ncbi:MAG: hypothetical protein CMH47_06140 [Muricauda sp.]|nr:hypothetical protein [Allomuricauda sp.]|tara:strand:- start:5631 stop:6107 length:477 start_codon:yes stop_codon:yes gene_type:complete
MSYGIYCPRKSQLRYIFFKHEYLRKAGKKFYSEIWDKKNFEEISNILQNDFSFRGSLNQEGCGHEEFKVYINYVHSALSSYKCIIKDLVVQNEKVFAKMIFTGVHDSDFMGYPPTGKQISWSGAALFIFSGQKVSSLWVLGDLKKLEEELDGKTKPIT